MMNDILTLVKTSYYSDEAGNQRPIEQKRTVFCKVSSVGRSEFYQAAQADMHPEYIFTISHYLDYEGEKLAEYKDHTGTCHILYVTRAYRVPDTDRIELTCEERTGDGNIESCGGSDSCPDRVSTNCAGCTGCCSQGSGRSHSEGAES